MFKSPFSFDGRIRRTEYGLSFLVYFLLLIGVQLTTLVSSGSKFSGANIIFLLFLIPCIIFMLAQGVKRSHDLGNSGWFILIPFYGLWLLFADSKEGINEYGPNPKGVGNNEEFSFERENQQ